MRASWLLQNQLFPVVLEGGHHGVSLEKAIVKAHLFSSWHIISKHAKKDKYLLVFWFYHSHLMDRFTANKQKHLCRHLSLANTCSAHGWDWISSRIEQYMCTSLRNCSIYWHRISRSIVKSVILTFLINLLVSVWYLYVGSHFFLITVNIKKLSIYFPAWSLIYYSTWTSSSNA